MPLISYPPEIRRSDDGSETNEAYLHWPDLHLSSFDDVECPTLDPTLLGHSFSRAMELDARHSGLPGHALLTPSVFKAPPAHLGKLLPTIGEVGLLWMGTFKPLWGTHHIRGTDPFSLSPYNLPVLRVEPEPDWRDLLPSESPMSCRPPFPWVWEGRLPGKGKDGKDLYARREIEEVDIGNTQFGYMSPPLLYRSMFVCASYDKWQTVAPRVRKDEKLKHLSGPLEYVMLTGGFSVVRWKTLVSDDMQPGADYDSTKTAAQNGLTRRLVSIGETDENVERAWISVRYCKCLSRKVYKARGKLDQEQRSVVDDVLEYLLDINPTFDMAVTGHDDIDLFLQIASQLPEYAGLITPSTTYAEFSSLLGTAIRLPVAGCHQHLPRYNFDARHKRHWQWTTQGWLADFLAKKQTVCFLPYVYDAQLWGQLP